MVSVSGEQLYTATLYESFNVGYLDTNVFIQNYGEVKRKRKGYDSLCIYLTEPILKKMSIDL